MRRWEPAFLEAIGRGCTVTKACELADVSRTTVYDFAAAETAEGKRFADAWAGAEDKYHEGERSRVARRVGDPSAAWG